MLVATAKKLKAKFKTKSDPIVDAMLRERGDRLAEINISDIAEHGNNHRMPSKRDKAAIAKLAESIEIDDVLHPVRVYPGAGGELHLVCGYRRCAASLACGKKTIPAIVMGFTPSNAQVQRMRAMENFAREDLNPAEKSLAVHEVFLANFAAIESREQALTATAKDFGESKKWVENHLEVIEGLAKKVREQLAANLITFDQARELIEASPELQMQFADQIIEQMQPAAGMVARLVAPSEVRGWIENEKKNLKSAPWKLEMPIACPAAEDLKKKEQACADCRWNSATRPTLPGLPDLGMKGGASAGTMQCRHPTCFEFRLAKFAKEAERATAELSAQIKEKKLAKAEAGTHFHVMEAMKKKDLHFARPEAVQEVVKRELKLTPAAGGAKGAAVQEVPKEKTEKEKRNEALYAWGQMYRAWAAQVCADVAAAALATPHLRLAMMALECAEPMCKLLPYELPPHSPQQYNYALWKDDVKPRPEKAASPAVAWALDQVAAGTYESLLRLAEKYDTKTFQKFDVTQFLFGPELMLRVARAFGVTPAAAPVFEDFLATQRVAEAITAGDYASNGVLAMRVSEIPLVGGKPLRYHVQYEDGSSGDQPAGSIHRISVAEGEAAFAAAAAKKAGNKKHPAAGEVFKKGVIVAMKMGGDLGVVERADDVDGKGGILVEWADQKSATMAPDKLRLARESEIIKYHEQVEDHKMAMADAIAEED